MRNFLDINKVCSFDLRKIIEDAKESKLQRNGLNKGVLDETLWLDGYVVALIFEKPSTRTRISFDVGVRQMGGKSMILSSSDLQLVNGENISDTAKVLSRYIDMIVIRTFDEKLLLELASVSTVPVINGLTNRTHPCQVMADIMTFEEYRGDIAGNKVVWLGDGNNVCASYIHAAVRFGFKLTISCPKEFSPEPELISWAMKSGGFVEIISNPFNAVNQADLVVTDTHISMHDDKEKSDMSLNLLSRYQVNNELMKSAKEDAIFMHCLPAHRNTEVTSDVIDGPQSVIFDEVENRLHVQKAIIRWCIDKGI